MTFPKRPLLVPVENSYPDKAAFAERIKRLVRVSAIGAAGLLITGCDHVADDTASTTTQTAGSDSEDTGYLAGGEEPGSYPTDSDSVAGTDSEYGTDSGYLAGDVAPETDSAVIDTATETATETAPDTEIGVDTGADTATDPATDTESATEIDTGIIAGAIE